MSNQDALLAQLAAMLGGLGLEPIEFTRLEFSAEGRSFIAYNAEGQAWGGDLNDRTLDLATVEARLLSDVQSGSLGKHFAIYEAVPAELVAEKRALNTDWRDIFVA